MVIQKSYFSQQKDTSLLKQKLPIADLNSDFKTTLIEEGEPLSRLSSSPSTTSSQDTLKY